MKSARYADDSEPGIWREGSQIAAITVGLADISSLAKPGQRCNGLALQFARLTGIEHQCTWRWPNCQDV